MGDRLVVGLRTLTPSAGVRIPLPQPDTEKPAQGGFFCIWLGERDRCAARFSGRSYPERSVGQAPQARSPSRPTLRICTECTEASGPPCAGFFISGWGRGIDAHPRSKKLDFFDPLSFLIAYSEGKRRLATRFRVAARPEILFFSG